MAVYTKGTLPPEEESFMTASQARYNALQYGDAIVKEKTQQMIVRVEENIKYAIQQGCMEVNFSFLRDVPVLEDTDTMTQCIKQVKDYFINLGYKFETSTHNDNIGVKIKW